MQITVTQDEAWAIFRYVRQHDRLGMEHDKDQAGRLHAALLWFKDNPAGNCEVELDESFCWWISRQLPDTVMAGTQPVGRHVLLKVMVALAAPAEEDEASEARTAEVGKPFREAFHKDDMALGEFERYLEERGSSNT